MVDPTACPRSSPAGSWGETGDQGVDEGAGDPAVGVEDGVEDRDVEAGCMVAGDRRSEDGDQLLPGQTVGEVVVDRGGPVALTVNRLVR